MTIFAKSTIMLFILSILAPLHADAVEGAVLYTRGTGLGGTGTLRLLKLGGDTMDLDSDVQAAVFSPDGKRNR